MLQNVNQQKLELMVHGGTPGTQPFVVLAKSSHSGEFTCPSLRRRGWSSAARPHGPIVLQQQLLVYD